MEKPIKIRAEDDTYIYRLLDLGNLINQQIKAGKMNDALSFKHIMELNDINLGVTPLERRVFGVQCRCFA